MSDTQESVIAGTALSSEADSLSCPETATTKKKSTRQSEVRTVRSITENLPEELRSKAKELFDAVQSNWKVYLSKDNAFRQSRADLAAALVEARKLLEEAGKKRLFHHFLQAKGIPRSTAYDLIKDFERAARAPEVLKIAAEQEGVDALEDRGLVGLEQGIRTEGRADVIGVGDELTAELVDEVQERITIEVNPD